VSEQKANLTLKCTIRYFQLFSMNILLYNKWVLIWEELKETCLGKLWLSSSEWVVYLTLMPITSGRNGWGWFLGVTSPKCRYDSNLIPQPGVQCSSHCAIGVPTPYGTLKVFHYYHFGELRSDMRSFQFWNWNLWPIPKCIFNF